MRANRIEITQQNHAPARIGFLNVSENALNHRFRCAVRAGGVARWHILGIRHFARIAINRRRRTEHNAKHARTRHFFRQHQAAGNIIIIIFYRLGHTFTHRFQAGKMNHRINAVFRKNTAQNLTIADIALIKRNLLAGNRFQAWQDIDAGIA
ncbi:Uncharacterised protein [Neisseria meningitidis]|nr:Uncharacterised protein [Neisseria meningitidis]